MQRVKKQRIQEGSSYNYSIGLTYAQGIGNSLANLVGGSGTSDEPIAQGARAALVTVNTANDYAALNLDFKSMSRSATSQEAFADQLKYQTDSLLQAFGDSMAAKLFGDAYGHLAACGSAGGGAITTVTLSNSDDCKYFQPGMHIQFFDSNKALVDGASDTARITAVNEATGALTFTSVTLTGNAVFVGRRDQMNGTGIVNLSGLSAWLPLSTPASNGYVGINSTSLISMSVNRSEYQTLTAGHRLDDTSLPIDEAAFKICQKIAERGGKPTAIYCSYDVYNALAIRQWNRVVPMDKTEAASTGMAGLALVTPNGKVPFIVDPYMLRDRCFVLDESSWRIVHSTPSIPTRITESAGNGGFFQLDDDAVQLRWRCWSNLICLRPVHNGVFSVSV
jgi:hypothetical protein